MLGPPILACLVQSLGNGTRRTASDPTLASVEAGAEIHRAVVTEFARVYREFLDEDR